MWVPMVLWICSKCWCPNSKLFVSIFGDQLCYVGLQSWLAFQVGSSTNTAMNIVAPINFVEANLA